MEQEKIQGGRGRLANRTHAGTLENREHPTRMPYGKSWRKIVLNNLCHIRRTDASQLFLDTTYLLASVTKKGQCDSNRRWLLKLYSRWTSRRQSFDKDLEEGSLSPSMVRHSPIIDNVGSLSHDG